MPARDGTGPEGKGAVTGRGMGPCTDRPKPTTPRRGRGRRNRR